MNNAPKAQLEIGTNTAPAEEGFKRVERAGKAMADAVGKSAQNAGKAVDGIGEGAGNSAQKLDRATSSMIASVQRTTAVLQAGEKGTAKYYETLANQRGVDASVLKPYLDGLRAVEAAQGKVGISAKQTAAAMRGVPAQFTDIVTSLQGGQAPMTVLLQQGGQLKDMFGGVGNAAKALGGYALGLVNPFTVAAAAMGTLAVAYYQGSKEADAFQKALLLTGNAAGASTAQLGGIAQSVSAGFGTTVGRAAEAITALASAGGVGRASLGEFAATAIAADKAFGIAATDIAKNFAELGKDPTAASLKLNESMNYLTASTFAQIKAAQDLGQQSQAAALAQDAYNSALKGRSAEVAANAGTIEKAWSGIKSVATGAWDAMLGVGRPVTIESQLTVAQKNLEAALAKRKGVSDDSAFAPALDKEIAKLKEQISYVGELERINKRSGDAAAERAAREKAGIQSQQDALKYLTDEQRMRNDIAQQTATMVTAGKSQAEIEERIAKIRASYANKGGSGSGGESELSSLRARIALNDEYLKSVQTGTAEAQKATEAERTLAKIKEDLAGSIKGVARANKEAALAAAERVVEQEKSIALFDAEKKRNDSLRKELETQLQQNAAIGKNAEATAELTAARLEDAAATAEQKATAAALTDPAVSQELATQAKLYRELAAAKRAGGVAKQGVDDNKAATEAAKKAMAEFDTLVGQIDAAKLNGLFNGAIDGALKFTVALNTVAEVSGKTQAALAANSKVNAGDGVKRASEEARILAQSATAQISAYGSMAQGLKSYAKEGSKAYTALYNAEKVFRAFELASAVSNMATKSGLLDMFVTQKVAGDQIAAQSAVTSAGQEAIAANISGQAKAVSGVVNQSGGDPYSAFPRMAAMAAIMAGLGFIVGGIGGGGSSAAPTNDGTGTVFGDSSAKSESLTKSLDLLNNTQDIALTYSKAMASSLRAIEGNIGGLTNIYLRTGGTTGLTDTIATGKFDSALSSVLKNPLLTGTGVVSALIPAFGGLVTSLFGGSTSITGTGISANKQTLGQIQNQGFQGNYYADVQTKKKAFGITYSSSNSTQLAGLDTTLEQQITAVFKNIGTAVGTAADFLGQDTAATAKRLQGYIVDIGRVNLSGLTGTQITEKLQNIFGAEADKLAASIVPGFEQLQKVGEGYFETLSRMANQFELVNVYMRRTGDTLGSVGVTGAKAADALIGLFGGLDAFQTSVQDFYEGFYSEAERAAQSSKEVRDALANIGKPMPATIEAFRDLVKAQDLTTTAGQEAYAALIQISPAFKKIADNAKEAMQAFEEAFYSPAELKASQFSSIQKAFDEIGLQSLPETLDGYRKLVDAQDQTTEAGKRARAMLIELGPQFADFIKEQEAAQAAIAQQRQGLQDQLDNLLGNTTALRARERAALDESNRALYDQVQALKDQQSAAQAAAQAQQEAAAKLQAIAQQRTGLQDQLDNLLGNTTALRARERAALDESNRALYDQVQALKDQQAVSQAAAAAEKQRQEAIKSSSVTVLEEVKRLRGMTTETGSAAFLQSQFAILTGQARAGDATALSKLPELSKAIEAAGTSTAKSVLDVERIKSYLAASLDATLAALGQNTSATVETPAVTVATPAASLAIMADGAEKAATQQQALIDEVKGLREQVFALLTTAQATAVSSDKAARTLDRVTQGTDTVVVTNA